MLGGYVRSDWLTREGFNLVQPVPFSHRHHAGQLGIDCRYCHDQVEEAASAGFPPTHTCMTCHSQLYTNAEALEPVRQSYARDEPLRWVRVHDVPDYVFFNHGIHISRGIACGTCHGPVEQMDRIYKSQPLSMGWCLDCHRDPAPELRAQQAVFAADWEPVEGRRAFGETMIERHGIDPKNLDHCYICHR